MNDDDSMVYIVDDNAAVRKSIMRLLRSVGIASTDFATAKEFQQHPDIACPCCLVLDVRMPGMTGPELQEHLAARGRPVPIIFLTGHGDVTISVKAMKLGAVDFLTKPFSDEELLSAIQNALQKNAADQKTWADMDAVQARVASLTPRETDVLKLVITGMLNKQIAYDLGISEKTVKVHRARVMSKMGVVSVAELVRMTEKVGITGESQTAL